MSDNKTNEGKLRSLQQVSCNTCSLSSLCLPVSLNMTEMERLDRIIDKSRPLKKVSTSSIKVQDSPMFLRFEQEPLKPIPSPMKAKSRLRGSTSLVSL